jgi:hypothetical protein
MSKRARKNPLQHVGTMVLSAAIGVGLGHSAAMAGPENGSGSAGVIIQDLGGGQWAITAPDGSIINYTRFDLASNEWGCLAVSHRECFPGLLPVDPALFTALEPIELLGLGGDPLRVLIYDGTGGGYDWRADLCDFSILQPLQLGHLPSAIAMSADTRTVIELVQIKETR